MEPRCAPCASLPSLPLLTSLNTYLRASANAASGVVSHNAASGKLYRNEQNIGSREWNKKYGKYLWQGRGFRAHFLMRERQNHHGVAGYPSQTPWHQRSPSRPLRHRTRRTAILTPHLGSLPPDRRTGRGMRLDRRPVSPRSTTPHNNLRGSPVLSHRERRLRGPVRVSLRNRNHHPAQLESGTALAPTTVEDTINCIVRRMVSSFIAGNIFFCLEFVVLMFRGAVSPYTPEREIVRAEWAFTLRATGIVMLVRCIHWSTGIGWRGGEATHSEVLGDEKRGEEAASKASDSENTEVAGLKAGACIRPRLKTTEGKDWREQGYFHSAFEIYSVL
ncbi:hypothetical protein DFH09DRAFT_1067637 [Mycena vulgaris]|nr:hypothetical protein DFH09DRAFT_1067637 [Mycena vulgaris]